jgi:RNA polymerase sigma-70 factor (ECF subfamily)
MTPSDHQLLRRIRERDAVAFDALFARYRSALHRHLARTLRDEGLADDLAQEAFLRVWLHADQWREQGSVRAWLFQIATNLALNHLRAARRRPQQPLDPTDDRRADEEEHPLPSWLIDTASLGPEALIEQAEQRASLRRLIDELPEEKREVMRLVHEAELAPREVAEALGLPEGTVRSRLHYARKQLARELEHYQ